MKKNYLLKSLVISIIILFCCSSNLAIGYNITGDQIILNSDNPSITVEKPVNDRNDDEDQSQTETTGGAIIFGNLLDEANVYAAQSFKPQLGALTRIELLVSRFETTSYPFFVTIRKQLTGSDIAQASVGAGEIPIDDFSWVEFDFENIIVDVNQTYWIVVHTENVTDNMYLWACNIQDPYDDGFVTVSFDGGQTWIEEMFETTDTCFITYGLESTELEIVSIRGGLGSVTYDIKNIGDSMAYGVVSTISITGGIFGKINITTICNSSDCEDCNGTIEPDDEKQEAIDEFIFGLGKIEIEIVVESDNSEKLDIESSGFVFGPKVWVHAQDVI